MSTFEYDVFLSFANADQSVVRPLWQELCLGGLRVFWSDSSLRDRLGASWFEVIQESLDRSQHLIVVFTAAALDSKWVKREYGAFLSHCHHPPSRLFVPILGTGVTVNDLPLFLREFEASPLNGDLPRRLVQLLGGTDVESLRLELSKTKELMQALQTEYDRASANLRESERHVAVLQRASEENVSLRAERVSLADKIARLTALHGTKGKEIERLRVEVATRNQDVQSLTAERELALSRLSDAESRDAARQKELEVQNKAWRSERNSLKSKVSEMTARLESAEARVRELEPPAEPASAAPPAGDGAAESTRSDDGKASASPTSVDQTAPSDDRKPSPATASAASEMPQPSRQARAGRMLLAGTILNIVLSVVAVNLQTKDASATEYLLGPLLVALLSVPPWLLLGAFFAPSLSKVWLSVIAAVVMVGGVFHFQHGDALIWGILGDFCGPLLILLLGSLIPSRSSRAAG